MKFLILSQKMKSNFTIKTDEDFQTIAHSNIHRIPISMNQKHMSKSFKKIFLPDRLKKSYTKLKQRKKVLKVWGDFTCTYLHYCSNSIPPLQREKEDDLSFKMGKDIG
jgi:uncharacterized membrane protein YgaE (UPF0421/DUF939 family)